ncbi:MAG TPA: chromate transporter [Anaeromyxobacteraceae bacterium]|nr:chromate transporter [Anaeromyxobacteraceae bacterium]
MNPPRSPAGPGPGELFRASLRLGATGFGGGLSVLSGIRSLCVDRRAWLSEREFARVATVAQMLPGGAAANALAYLGLRFGGRQGAVAGYAGFVLPGFVATFLLAVLYARLGVAPGAGLVLDGFNAAVVGIIGSITIQMVRGGIGRLWQMGLAAAALLLSLPGGASAGEVALLGVAVGLVADLSQKRARLYRYRARQRTAPVALPDEGAPLPEEEPAEAPSPRGETPPGPGPLPLASIALAGGAGLHLTGLDAELFRIFVAFFRTGLGAYGGGFAIVPHLQGVLVGPGWLTARQFADAVAIGKLTPGPVLLMATFAGYLLGGPLPALAATLGIFIPPLILVIALGSWLDRVRQSRMVRAALRGLTPAVVGLMAAAAVTMGRSLGGAPALAIAIATGLTLQRFPMNPVLLIAAGGVARLAAGLLGV